jgi:RNase adaptor protein for sRNA GlmZ degradation
MEDQNPHKSQNKVYFSDADYDQDYRVDPLTAGDMMKEDIDRRETALKKQQQEQKSQQLLEDNAKKERQLKDKLKQQIRDEDKQSEKATQIVKDQ